MKNQLIVRHIRTKRKIREIVTYIDDDCELRREHEKIVSFLRKNVYNSLFAKAYVCKGGIFENAKAHMYNDVFIKLDIKDFFNSIDHEKLKEQLYIEINKRNKITENECWKIVHKCSCGYYGLPLGLVSSPDLANIFLKRFDNLFYGRIRRKARKCNIENVIYTRYADDLTVSFKYSYSYSDFVSYVKKVAVKLLAEFGLELNKGKTKICRINKSNHVRITGISIVKDDENYRTISVGKKLKNEIFWKAINYYDYPEKVGDNEIQQLKGMLSFVLSIEKKGISFTYSRGMRQLIYDRGYKNIIELVRALPNTGNIAKYNRITWRDSDNDELDELFYHESFTSTDDDDTGFDPSTWNKESILRINGYTVSKQEGLSDWQRQIILRNIYETKKMTKYQMIDHLEAMISLRQYQSRYNEAIEKWRRDIKYLREI